MAAPRIRAGGGFTAILYTLRMGWRAGGPVQLWRRLRAKNACKTCALGMGGQRGGMVNEIGHFPEVCKKSLQAQVGDMQPPIAESFFATTSLADLQRYSSAALERLGRLSFPLICEPGDTHYRRIGWDEALARTGKALQGAGPQRSFLYVSGRSSNEAAFLAQLVMRAFGSANIHNCSYYCHQASGVALGKVYGSGTASVTLDDLGHTDLAIVVGANPPSNHPRMMTQLMHLKRRGGRVLVINPIKELGLVRFRVPSDWRSLLFGSTIADLFLQPKVGSDIALFKALLKGLLELDGADTAYIAAHTAGWEAVQQDIARASWEDLSAACGIARADIDRAVQMIYGAERGVCMWAMGLTHHQHGVDNILALSNLALAKGWLGRPGAGLLPIRGHSNVQGVGSVGVKPALKEAFASALAERYGISLPSDGQDTYASMQAAAAGDIDAALLLGGNLYGSNPDTTWAGGALGKIGTVIHVSTKLNTGHVHTHGKGQTSIILPALCRDEESQRTTQESMFNYVRISDGGLPLVRGEMRSEVDIIASVAERILPPGRFDWQDLRSHAALRAAIAAVVPGYRATAAVDSETGQKDPRAAEFQITGRTFHEPQFSTADGKAHFHVTPMPDLDAAEGEFRLMTVRSEGQFNTVVYEQEDLYRGATRRDAVLMAASDAARLGLAEGDQVVVQSSAGSMHATVSLADIRPGCLAMYYPEANVLVPRAIDARSKTPAFKGVSARVTPAFAARADVQVRAAAG